MGLQSNSWLGSSRHSQAPFRSVPNAAATFGMATPRVKCAKGRTDRHRLQILQPKIPVIRFRAGLGEQVETEQVGMPGARIGEICDLPGSRIGET